MRTKFLLQNLRGRDRLEDLDIGVEIILKCISKEKGGD
jgi:hypothetical protein